MLQIVKKKRDLILKEVRLIPLWLFMNLKILSLPNENKFCLLAKQVCYPFNLKGLNGTKQCFGVRTKSSENILVLFEDRSGNMRLKDSNNKPAFRAKERMQTLNGSAFFLPAPIKYTFRLRVLSGQDRINPDGIPYPFPDLSSFPTSCGKVCDMTQLI